jgi:hypothetical protein
MATISDNLVPFLAQMCAYAQEHVNDADAWPIDPASRSSYFSCTSYQVACFIAQNTIFGSDGVEADVVLDQLIQRPAKTESEWRIVLQPIVNSYNSN